MPLALVASVMRASNLPPDLGGAAVAAVQTDSRKVQPGELFFCIPGERFDGHDFASQALEQGALAVVAERELTVQGPVLYVDDALAALGRLARAHRNAARATVVGVTGSAGKTTVKEFLASICAQSGPTAKNHLNLNNQLGLPLSMLRASGEERYWVFEAGINYDGEMDILGGILAPDVALVVNVGGAHTEGLGGLEGVARNKTLLFKHLQPGGKAVFSADYPELVSAASYYGGNTLRFSVQGAPVGRNGALCRGAYLGPEPGGLGRYGLDIAGEPLTVVLPWRGVFMAENAAAAAAVAHAVGISRDMIKRGLEEARPAEHRFQRFEKNGLLLVDDAYNANPLSMSKAIAGVLELSEGRPLALVLGEMLELGQTAQLAHEDLGRKVAESGAKLFIWRGGHAEDVQRGLESAGYDGEFHLVRETGEFMKQWQSKGLRNGVVLFKGSRAMRMEEFCEALHKELHA